MKWKILKIVSDISIVNQWAWVSDICSPIQLSIKCCNVIWILIVFILPSHLVSFCVPNVYQLVSFMLCASVWLRLLLLACVFLRWFPFIHLFFFHSPTYFFLFFSSTPLEPKKKENAPLASFDILDVETYFYPT